MKGVVYIYIFPNGKVYIGQTINPRARMVQHLSRSVGPRNVGFWRAYKKYGSFKYEELDKVSASTEEELREKLNTLEQLYISQFKSNDRRFGYNLTSGGSAVYVINEEGRRRMSEARTDKIPVLQYTLDGVFVAKYESVIAAAKGIHSSASTIYACCVGGRNNRGKWKKVQVVKGFTFRFEKDYPEVPLHIKVNLTSNNKPILQYSLAGAFIKEWGSIKEAEAYHGRSVHAACCGKYRQAGGYMWRYRDEFAAIPLSIEPVKEKKKRPFPKLSQEQIAKGKRVHFEKYAIPVYQFALDGSYVGEYPSTKDAAEAVGGDRGTICNACKNTKVHSAYGFQWRRKEDVVNAKRGIDEYVLEFGPRKAVLQLDMKGQKIAEWRCAKDVADYLGVQRNTVYIALANRKPLKGYLWEYK